MQRFDKRRSLLSWIARLTVTLDLADFLIYKTLWSNFRDTRGIRIRNNNAFIRCFDLIRIDFEGVANAAFGGQVVFVVVGPPTF